MLPSLFAALAAAAQPRCPTDLAACHAFIDGGRFQNAYYNPTASADDRRTLCSKANWVRRERCYTECNARLVVTHPLEYEGITSCILWGQWMPYEPDMNVDAAHPLVGEDMPIIYPGRPGAKMQGCPGEDSFPNGADGAIVLADFWGCPLYMKMLAARAAGAKMTLIVDSRHDVDADGVFAIGGPSQGLADHPGGAIDKYAGYLLQEAFDRNISVRGRVEMACADVDAPPPPAPPAWDGCPSPSLVDVCTDAALAEDDRLCSKCPLRMRVPLPSGGGGGGSVADAAPGGGTNSSSTATVCLFGNQLYPRAAATYLQYQAPAQVPVTLDAVHPIFEGIAHASGCSPADYAGLEGKIVVVTPVASCYPMIQVRSAQAAGVRAFVSLGPSLHGKSQGVRIPVHTLAADDAMLLGRLFTSLGARDDGHPALGPRYALAVDVADLDVATVVVHPSPSAPAPLPQVEAAGSIFTAGVCVAIACIVVLSILIVLILVRQWRAYGDVPRAMAKVIDVDKSRATVPLSAATILIMLVLAVTIAVVTFHLVSEAGDDAVDTAVSDGERAANMTYLNSQEVVDQMSLNLRKQVLDSAVSKVGYILDKGEMLATEVAQIHSDFDGSWEAFDGNYNRMVDSFHAHHPREASLATVLANIQWLPAVKTTQNFYGDPFMKTDDRSDAARGDGKPHVSVTRNGSQYGLAVQALDPVSQLNEPVYVGFPYPANLADSPLTRVAHSVVQEGGRVLDKVAAVAGQPRNSKKWVVSTAGLLFNLFEEFAFYPVIGIALLTPVYTRANTFVGAVEVSLSLAAFGEAITEVAQGVTGSSSANLSIAVYTRDTLQLIATNDAPTSVIYNSDLLIYDDSYFTISHYTPRLRAKTIAETRQVYFNAMHYYLADHMPVGGAAGVPAAAATHFSGEFDQQAYYGSPDFYWARVAPSSGAGMARVDAAVDTSANKIKVEMRGGNCGACVSADADGRRVFNFTGDNTIYMYLNLTTGVPTVAATRIGSGDDPWASSDPFYANTMPIPGTDELCVYRPYFANPVNLCSIRGSFIAHPFTLHFRVKPGAAVDPDDPTQQLASETEDGESHYRATSNGQFSLMVSRRGCQTKGYPTPAGEWTQFTFVRTIDECLSYVNGELYDRAAISSFIYFTVQAGAPMVVGHRFRGLMDTVHILELDLDPVEVRTLTTTGTFTRNTPSKRYYAQVQGLVREGDLSSGVDWVVATLLPRADVMRDVDAHNNRTLSELAIHATNTQTTLDARKAQTVVVCVAIGLASMLVFLVFNDFLIRPLQHVTVAMCDAAAMRVDHIDATRTCITETNAMNDALRVMFASLREYRAYMPMSVLVESESGGSDAEGSFGSLGSYQSQLRSQAAAAVLAQIRSPDKTAVAEGSKVSPRSTTSPSPNPSPAPFASVVPAGPRTDDSSDRESVAKSARSSSDAGGAGESGSNTDRPGARRPREVVCLAVKRKRFSLLVANIRGFAESISIMHDVEIIGLCGRILQQVIDKTITLRGIVDTFSGDRYLCSFNASKQCGAHRTNAVDAAVQIKDAVRAMNLSLNAGVACGDGRLGNVGNAALKKYTFLSPIVGWANAMERFGRHVGVGVVIEKNLADEMKTVYFLRAVGRVVFPKMARGDASAVFELHEVMKARPKQQNDEWMYQLEKAQTDNPYHTWDAWFDAIVRGRWEVAAKEHAELEVEKVEGSAIYGLLAAAMRTCTWAPDEQLHKYF